MIFHYEGDDAKDVRQKDNDPQLSKENDSLMSVCRDLMSQCDQLRQREQELAMSLHYEKIKVLQLNYKLKGMQSGVDGALVAPFKYARSVYRKLTGRYRLHFVPVHQLEFTAGGIWQATGNDPQFVIFADINWSRLEGWYLLEIDVESEHDLEAQIYFDVDGNGYKESDSVRAQILAKKTNRIPIFIPRDCKGIRLDPCQFKTSFRFKTARLIRLKERPDVAEEAKDLLHSYSLLGGIGGNWSTLVPNETIGRFPGNEYSWVSENNDPWFRVVSDNKNIKKGWHRIDLLQYSKVKRGVAKFYFDFGDGFNETDSVRLPYMSGVTASRIVYLRLLPISVRFDPLESVSAFSIDRLNITAIGEEVAKKESVEKICEHGDAYKDRSSDDVWRDAVVSAKKDGQDPLLKLYEIYDSVHFYGQESADYSDWIQRNEDGIFDVNLIAKRQQEFAWNPVISIVMPTYNTSRQMLSAAIESVLRQSYPNWQLCIADDASTDSITRDVLLHYEKLDSRINIVFREENGHISAASNSALDLANGDFVALLDHDDEFAQHALHYVVDCLNRSPDAKIIYTDEDKIDVNGNRSEPHFKSDWNPDLFLSQNYVSHLGVYRRDIIEKIGGFRRGVEGSQDQDLLLRCLPLVRDCEIHHIPLVLYHWRSVEGSTAKSAAGKSYTTDAGVKSLRDYFDLLNRPDIQVEEGLVANTYRVRYPIPNPAPLVSLIIPTRDHVDLLKTCIQSIVDKSDYTNFEIIILDNGSVEPETISYFDEIQRAEPRVRVLPYHHPFNYSAINNFGVMHAEGDVIGLINNDVEVINPGWLSEMVSNVCRPEIGCVGAKLYYSDNTIQHAGVIVGLGGVAGHSHKYFPRDASGYFHRLKVAQNLSAVTAACLLVRKSVFLEVGGLEEDALKVAFNDVDFCLKVRKAGYRNLWTPYAELYHYESKSRGSEDTPEKIARFASEINFMQGKWNDYLAIDPYYSQNLTLSREDFSIS
ncbi:glycosyl transferase family 2 [Burkholderia anthina]|nr:glycosyl transferase family 2 [Burkholderia anthina]